MLLLFDIMGVTVNVIPHYVKDAITEHYYVHAHIHTHTHPFYGPLVFVQDYTGELVTVWILLNQAVVALAGPYASLHLIPDR